MSTYVTVLKIQWYLKLAHTYLYWIHKNLYHGYKNLSVAAMKKNCILQYVSNSLEMGFYNNNATFNPNNGVEIKLLLR